MDNRAETADAMGWFVMSCLGWQGVAMAQGTVKGFVRAEEDGAPVLFAVVLEGFCLASHRHPGVLQPVWCRRARPRGLQRRVQALPHRGGRVGRPRCDAEHRMGPGRELESAVISTEQGEQLNTVRVSVESIQPADIKRIPAWAARTSFRSCRRCRFRLHGRPRGTALHSR